MNNTVPESCLKLDPKKLKPVDLDSLKCGQVFVYTDEDSEFIGTYYLLTHIGGDEYILVDLHSGERWSNPDAIFNVFDAQHTDFAEVDLLDPEVQADYVAWRQEMFKLAAEHVPAVLT